MLDKAKLLAYLRAKAEHPSLLIYAVLTAAATAIERGDFDVEEKED